MRLLQAVECPPLRTLEPEGAAIAGAHASVPCGKGYGVAVSTTLGLLVACDQATNRLHVWAFPRLHHVRTIGGGQLKTRGWHAGYVAFTEAPNDSAKPLLMVSDACADVVHLVDVVSGTHAGHLAPPGTIKGPRGVAASAQHVAVSAWRSETGGQHVVHLFMRDGPSWKLIHTLGGDPGNADGKLRCPMGLRLSAGGCVLVTDRANHRVSRFRVGDGTYSFVDHIVTGVEGLWDVEECEGGGWVVAAGQPWDTVLFVSAAGCLHVHLGDRGGEEGEFDAPTGLALVPGLGLVTREFDNSRVQLLRVCGRCWYVGLGWGGGTGVCVVVLAFVCVCVCSGCLRCAKCWYWQLQVLSVCPLPTSMPSFPALPLGVSVAGNPRVPPHRECHGTLPSIHDTVWPRCGPRRVSPSSGSPRRAASGCTGRHVRL